MQPDQRALLEEYRPWLLQTAHSMYQGDGVQDLAQEGWIAMWRALATYDPRRGTLDMHLKMEARWRMRRCVLRRTWLGTPDRRTAGYGGTAGRRYAEDVEQGMFSDAEDRLVQADIAEEIEWAYHRGEILRALAELPAAWREKVYRRFWLGENLTGGWWYQPRTGARARLRERLEHLHGLLSDRGGTDEGTTATRPGDDSPVVGGAEGARRDRAALRRRR